MGGRIFVLTAAVLMAAASGCDDAGPTTVPDPAPVVTSLEPATAPAGSAGLDLVVRGSGFVGESRVTWNGEERSTTWVGATELRAVIPAGDLGAEGTANVRVVSPGGSGGASGALVFSITAPLPGPVATVEIDAASLSLEEGQEAVLTATARDASGTVVTGRFVQWASSDLEVAPVGALGRVSAIRTGSATITARVDGVTASIPVSVTADYAYDLLFVGTEGAASQVYATDLSDPTRSHAASGLPEGAGGAVPSLDGTRIAFLLDLESGLRALMVAAIDGSDASELRTTDDVSCGSFSWSPDGARLAFSCRIEGDDRDIWVMDSEDGGNLVSLTGTHAGRQEQPSWSPEPVDGAFRIAYAQWVDGEPQIWSMKTDGSDPRQITAGMDWQPAWSPDATRIAFQRTGAGTFGDLYLVDAAGGNERHLVGASLAGPQWSPRWSPDGRLLAFSSTHETYSSGAPLVSQIYTVWASDGTKLARRTTGDLDKYAPAWRMR